MEPCHCDRVPEKKTTPFLLIPAFDLWHPSWWCQAQFPWSPVKAKLCACANCLQERYGKMNHHWASKLQLKISKNQQKPTNTSSNFVKMELNLSENGVPKNPKLPFGGTIFGHTHWINRIGQRPCQVTCHCHTDTLRAQGVKPQFIPMCSAMCPTGSHAYSSLTRAQRSVNWTPATKTKARLHIFSLECGGILCRENCFHSCNDGTHVFI